MTDIVRGAAIKGMTDLRRDSTKVESAPRRAAPPDSRSTTRRSTCHAHAPVRFPGSAARSWTDKTPEDSGRDRSSPPVPSQIRCKTVHGPMRLCSTHLVSLPSTLIS